MFCFFAIRRIFTAVFRPLVIFFPSCPLQTEGIALAQAADLPADKLLTVLDQGAMSNPLFRMKVRQKNSEQQ